MKYPFYTWFSIIGVMIQFVKTAIQIVTARPFRFENWVRFCLRFLVVFAGFIMIPGGLMAIALGAILQYNEWIGHLWNVAIYVVLYVMGVLAAQNLYRWEVKHMTND